MERLRFNGGNHNGDGANGNGGGGLPRKPISKALLTAPQRVQIRTMLTVELIEQFATLLQEGRTLDATCDYLEVSQMAFHNWVRSGTAYLLGEGEPKEHWIFGLFVQRMRKACAEFRFWLEDNLKREDDRWQKWMCWLERRDRKNYSRNEQPGGSPEQINPDERFF